MKLNSLPAAEIARQIATGALKSEAVVRACVDRALARESELQAWAFLDADQAIAEARQRDRERPRGPLHGVPVGIKDIMDTFDMPTGYGSAIYANHRPACDCVAVALARSAGAVIMGKTVTVEFAASHPAATRNPHNLAHTPGGSSSGSAAAVADLQVPVAVGTQTGGSVIRPAAFCGIVGLKMSYGEAGLYGTKCSAWSLDTAGVFGRSVEDVALLRSVLVGSSPARLDGAPGLRIGLFHSPFSAEAEPSALAELREVARRLASGGAIVTEVAPPQSFADTRDAQRVIARFEMARNLDFEYRRHRDLLSATIRAEIEQGRTTSFDQYRSAQQLAALARAEIDAAFDSVDALLCLAAPGEAPKGFATTGSATFNRSWTLLGLPCITLPTGRGPQQLPIGVQLVGRYRADEALLCYAAWIERALVA